MTPLKRLSNRFRHQAVPPAAPAPEQQDPAVDETPVTALLTPEQAIAAGVLTRGHGSYGGPSITRYPGDDAKVRIGRYCSIAADAAFMVGGNHRPDWVTTYPLRVMLDLPGALTDGHPATKGDIVVGSDVWIGAEARILSGTKIGDGAVIGAGSVVAGAVRPYAIMVGNPAQEVRRRFSDPLVEALLRIAWWDWADETVQDRVEELCNPDVETFVRRYDRS